MKRRVFIALPISDSFKRKIEGWKKEFWVKNPDVNNKIRWIPPENLHITLIPPFNRDEKGIKEATVRLSGLEGEIGSFNIIFERISYGPALAHPRLVWISGRHEVQAETLRQKIEQLLRLSPDKRPFSPHVTVARFREYDFRTFSLRRLDEQFEFRETFEEFLLLASKTLPKGTVYQILGKFRI